MTKPNEGMVDLGTPDGKGAPVKGIIFDFFGVVSLRMHRKFLETYVPDFAQRKEEFEELGRQADRGLISLEEYSQIIAEVAHTTVDEYQRYNHSSRVLNHDLLEYIRAELKPHYKIGMLSNAGKDLLSFAGPGELEKIFDAITISSEIGVIKPDPQAFQVACSQLGVAPTEAVMVDDLPDNCVGARAVGMRAVQYDSLQQMRQELEQLLAVATVEVGHG